MLTPIAKSWPSEWCLEANSLAIQVHGGYGYTRDFPVEQYWRDNRLNMIHEGTHGIQAADLLGRKVLMEGGRGLQLLAGRINGTIERAIQRPRTGRTRQRAGQGACSRSAPPPRRPGPPAIRGEALANAVPYMQAFGHLVLAWIWLDVALAAAALTAAQPAARGPRCAPTRYFFHYELPKIGAWLGVVETRDPTCAAHARGGVLMASAKTLRAGSSA